MSADLLPAGYSACRKRVAPQRRNYVPRNPRVLGGAFFRMAWLCGLLKETSS
jgi:hypothetical protein